MKEKRRFSFRFCQGCIIKCYPALRGPDKTANISRRHEGLLCGMASNVQKLYSDMGKDSSSVRISALVSPTTFCGEVSKCGLLSQATFVPEDMQRIRINMSLRMTDTFSHIVLLLRGRVELFCVFATTEYIFLAFCHLDIVLKPASQSKCRFSRILLVLLPEGGVKLFCVFATTE